MAKFFDMFWLLHHKCTKKDGILTSENAPMFTGAYYIEKEHLLFLEGDRIETALASLWDSRAKIWRTTNNSESRRFSHDNFKGLICMIKAAEKDEWLFAGRYREKVPLFHRQLIHPRDFILIGYFKYPLLFFWLLPIPWAAMLISCWQTYKVRNGHYILKTDGKILCRMMCKAFNWTWLLKVATLMLNRKRKLRNGKAIRMTWNFVYTTYFQEPGHPLREVGIND